MEKRVARVGLGSTCWLIVATWAATAQGPAAGDPATDMIRDGFETPKIAWRQEDTDATVKIFAHDRTNRAAHEGLLSEGFQFEAGIGGGLYFSYALPRVPVTPDLKVGLYVRSNRSGMQLLGRVVLPGDVDPDSRRPSFVLVPGTIFESADRWQKLELADMMPSIERQARVLRASTKRKVSLEGAYLERLIVNIYGGEGETEVYLDELTVGPVPAELLATPRAESSRGGSVRMIADQPRGPAEPLEALQPGLNSRIKLDRNRLTKDGYPWFFSAVRAPGADPIDIRKAGCDALVLPKDAPEQEIRAAIANGLLLIPELTGPDDRVLPDADRLAGMAAAYPGRDAVAFWSLGENLGQSTDIEARKASLARIREAAQAIRKARPGGSPLTTGTVVGMLPEYSRVPQNLDVIGIPVASWATVQGYLEQYQYLEQRKLLTARGNPDALLWASLDAAPPPIYQEAIWGTDPPPSWGMPRVQPEQIRLSTYAALAGGCRGICYRADSDLTSGPGRMNMIEIALLNEEIDLLEPILADPDKSVRMLDTYFPDPPAPQSITLFQMGTAVSKPPTPKEFPPHPTIKAAAFTTKDRRGTLLMLADFVPYSQYQPPQSAMNNIKLLVPAASDAHAYLITAGGVQAFGSQNNGYNANVGFTAKRAPGGIEMYLEDFGPTAIILVTTNVELKDQIERAINRVRPLAVSLAIEQAELQRAWVAEIDSLIQDLRHPQKDSAALLDQANELIKSAREALEREDYPTAWSEARRVGRPLRILMRYHFMACYDDIVKALRDEDLPCGPIVMGEREKPQPRLIAPIVAAPLASFSTLPQAWIWYEWIRSGRLGKNLIPNGDFNDPDTLKKGWTPVSYRTEDIRPDVRLNKGGADMDAQDKDLPKEGRNLYLESRPRDGLTVDSLAPFVDHPVVAVRSPAVKVGARQVYRISVMAFVIHASNPGAGGVIVRDSIGGERLQFRTPQALAEEWFEIVYYRRAPEDGTMSITLGLAGYGWAAFDDLKVEPIVETIDPEQIKLTARPKRKPKKPKADSDSKEAKTDAKEKAERASTARSRPVPVRQ